MRDHHDADGRMQRMPATNRATDEPVAVGIERLTARQQRLLRLLVSGATAVDLAAQLGLSARVARREQHEVLAALGVGNVQEAAVLWWGSRAGARADLRAAVEHFRIAALSTGSAAA